MRQISIFLFFISNLSIAQVPDDYKITLREYFAVNGSKVAGQVLVDRMVHDRRMDQEYKKADRDFWITMEEILLEKFLEDMTDLMGQSFYEILTLEDLKSTISSLQNSFWNKNSRKHNGTNTSLYGSYGIRHVENDFKPWL